MAFGISHLSAAERKERFPTAEKFRELWESDRRVFAVGETRAWSRRLAQDGITRARLLWEGEGLALLSNERSAK